MISTYMMQPYDALGRQLKMLAGMIERLGDEQFVKPVAYLSNSTIGQHSRHVIELLQCLLAGYNTGFVNYDKRKRALAIEQDRQTALTAIEELLMGFSLPDKPMIFEAALDEEGETTSQVSTTYQREIVYNIEHAIHHMALIKVGLYDMGIDSAVLSSFGVAYATMQHRNECAQ